MKCPRWGLHRLGAVRSWADAQCLAQVLWIPLNLEWDTFYEVNLAAAAANLAAM